MYIEIILESIILYISIACTVFLLLSRTKRKQFFLMFPLLILFIVLAFRTLMQNDNTVINVTHLVSILFKLVVVIYFYFSSFNLYKKKLERDKEKRLNIYTPFKFLDNSPVSNIELENTPSESLVDKRYLKSQLPLEEQLVIKEKIEQYFDNDKKRYLDPEFNLTELSKDMGVLSQHLSQTFNLTMNISFSNYINEKRINHACNELEKNPRISVFGLSEMCGYKSRASFYRNFTIVKGVTFVEYKKQSGANM